MPYHSRKYKVNESFFSSWSPEMAYVLGFWFADGNMRHEKSYRIRFFEGAKDVSHLKTIRKTLKSNHRLCFAFSRKSKTCTFSLIIYSKQMFKDLWSLGGRPANSNTLQFPNVPNRLLPDFIRGFFDGDGSVHYIKYKHAKNSKIYQNIRSNFTCGSLPFLEKIRDYLTEILGVYKRKLCGDGKPPTRWKLGYGENDTRRLLKYMYYPNHRLSLKRKAEFLKKFKKESNIL